MELGHPVLVDEAPAAADEGDRTAVALEGDPQGAEVGRDRDFARTLADVVAHIDHVKQIAGVGAVGIGSDFDGVGCTPEGLDDVSKFPNLTRALLEKGYSAEDIRKIYGGNLLRVMRAAEVAAGK